MGENINGLSRRELLKRGALGIAAVSGAEALLGAAPAGARCSSPEAGRQVSSSVSARHSRTST